MFNSKIIATKETIGSICFESEWATLSCGRTTLRFTEVEFKYLSTLAADTLTNISCESHTESLMSKKEGFGKILRFSDRWYKFIFLNTSIMLTKEKALLLCEMILDGWNTLNPDAPLYKTPSSSPLDDDIIELIELIENQWGGSLT
ncbi:MAG: hypothetical protein OCC49_08760 [Fibrobacterales bacterium]